MEATGKHGELEAQEPAADFTMFPRTWTKSKSDCDNSGGVRFTVVSYNVLTDLAIPKDTYLYCPEKYRYMKDRHPRILAELNTMNADIVCLQEVDVDHWNRWLRRDMEGMGYKGVYFESYTKEGMATFYKETVFTLLDDKSGYHHDLAETYIKAASIGDSKKEKIRTSAIRPKGTILVKLQHVSGDVISVANIHAVWDDLKYPALQALQVSAAVNRLVQFAGGAPHIICGDFNTPPEFPAYHMLTHGRLAQEDEVLFDRLTDYLDKEEIQASKDLVEQVPDAFCLQSRLKSVYKTLLGQEPAVTCYDATDWPRRKHMFLCLDYLWFSHQCLDVCAVLEAPSPATVVKHTMPSQLHPSDHLPIQAEFVFKLQTLAGSV